MTKEEFVKTIVNRGYCSKKTADRYTESHAKDDYSEEDIMQAWRDLNPEYMRNRPVKKASFDEENWVYKLI